MVWIGCLAFGLFALHDWNDLTWGKTWLRCCFPLGAALLTLAVAGSALSHPAPWTGVPRAAAWVLAVVFLALLAYTLTFALKPAHPYSQPGAKRPVCRTGVYALCRHPGVLWLGLALLCLYPAAGLPLAHAALYTLLDVLLVWFEDALVFPKALAGYDDYRREVPFLLPRLRFLGKRA